MDHVADADIASDTVLHVLKYLFCPGAFPRRDGATYPVGTNLDGFDNTYVIPAVVIHEQRAAGS